MYEVVPFKAEHMDNMLAAEPGEIPEEMQNREFYAALESQPNSWTLLREGEPLWCGGTIEQWPGRHLGWSYVSQNAGPAMRRITREAVRVLDRAPGRTEITVKADFVEGHRWAQLLGFEIETPLLRAYAPDGSDHVGYVRFV